MSSKTEKASVKSSADAEISKRFSELIEQTNRILKDYKKIEPNLEKDYITQYKKYKNLYESIKIKADFIDAFKRAFVPSVSKTLNLKIKDIIKEEIDDWLAVSKIDVIWTINPKKDSDGSRYQEIKFNLSAIYRNCLYIAEYIEKNPEAAGKLNRKVPELFYLHLYRLFLTVADEKYTKDISEMIQALEEACGIKKTPDISNIMSGDGMSQIINFAVGMMQKMGMDVGDVNADEVASKVQSITNSPKVKEIAKSLGNELRSCSDPMQVLDKLSSHASVGTRDAIAEAMPGILDITKPTESTTEDEVKEDKKPDSSNDL
jgi:hypothetical protein